VQFAQGIRRLFLGMLACLLLIGLSATYWAIAGRGSLLLRDDNPRLIEAIADIQRGAIYDRGGQLLAETTASEASLRRRYLRPSTYSVVGYYSLRYGAGAAEAAFDELLSGSSAVMTLRDYVERKLLKLPQVGADIRLTVDANIQDALAAAMGDAAGAIVVLNAQSGAIQALLSQPGFDPNALDEDWQELVEAANQPFFNRALQGHYQLGGAMYMLLLAQVLRSDADVTMRFPKADAPVSFKDGMTITCVIKPEQSELSLIDAYIYGCPAAFQAHWLAEPRQDLAAILAPFAFDAPVTLAGFPQPEPIALPAAAEALDEETLMLRALHGQGDVTTTPLHTAAIMAAIATDGKAVAPAILSATRPPDAAQWRPLTTETSAPPILSAGVARELRGILRRAWSILGDGPAGDVGANIVRSQSGDQRQIWLTGFVANADGAANSFVILLENSDDAPRLISIGQTLVRALAQHHQGQPAS